MWTYCVPGAFDDVKIIEDSFERFKDCLPTWLRMRIPDTTKGSGTLYTLVARFNIVLISSG